MNATPKCPSCAVQGLPYLVSSESEERSYIGDAWFHIAHCSACGHVYGIFTKEMRASRTPLFPSFVEEHPSKRDAGG